MVIFLYGPDSYRRNIKIKELIDSYKLKKQETDLLSIDLESDSDDWIRARDFLGQPSLFLDSKVLVIKESGVVEKKEWILALKSELKTPKTFVLISDKNKPTKNFNFLLKEPVKNQNFPELEGEKLKIFIKLEAEKKGLVFDPEAFNCLFDYMASVEERSWVVVNELQKLLLLGLPKPIPLKAIKEIYRLKKKDPVFFEAQRILSLRSVGQKMERLETLFLGKEAGSYIFNSLAFGARGRETEKLADYDVLIKSGKLDYEEALLDFVITS